MKARCLGAFAISVMATTAWAHHSYGMFYELDKGVLMKGRVETISFVEPHVRLIIETKNSGSWEAEWTGPKNLMRGGVANDTLHSGDLLEIEGSPARDPNRRVVSALREIRRPADGWHWTRSETAIPISLTIE